MREKKLKLNTITSLIFQITTIVCGFILPRLIIRRFGSEVNGLVNSINQFLQFIAFLELGVGAVIQSSLYKPLAEKDSEKVSQIIRSGNRFFRKIAIALLVYVIVLIAFFPLISKGDFEHSFSATLIATMSISFFSQYYFGVVDRLLLSADQKGYIHYTAQTITLILNTVASAVLIYNGASIQIVKLITSLIYLVRPLFLHFYVNKMYSIDRNIQIVGEPIKQKWNGIAQHVAAIILDGTDIIVLTFLSTLSNVSIYSVYHLVVNGVKQLFMSATNGIQSLIGDMWARKEIEKLQYIFQLVEWVIHTGVVFVFGCTIGLILPFVKVYTTGVTDVNYVLPLFGVLISLANAGHCIRLPYSIMILAVGHYKQTQNNYIIAAVINIGFSMVLVKQFGLIGVAIGTLAAMLYQTIWMASYCYKKLLQKSSMFSFWKQFIVDMMVFFAIIVFTLVYKYSIFNYFDWAIHAVLFALTLGGLLLLVNIILYKDKMLLLKKYILER